MTQALLQIPFGILSDRIGRLPIIYFGLAIRRRRGSGGDVRQHLGCGRGAGAAGRRAISAAVMALLRPTREQHRTKAMALIG